MHVIAIAGCSGSGKTTLAQLLAQKLAPRKTLAIEFDSYYRDLSHLPFKEREQQNFDHPDSIEAELLLKHLKQLVSGEPAEIPGYDFTKHLRRQETFRVMPSEVIIIEGIYALYWPEIRELCTHRIFVEAPGELCFSRRLERDQKERERSADSIVFQWNSTVEPMYRAYCLPTKAFATHVIDGALPFNQSISELVEQFD